MFAKELRGPYPVDIAVPSTAAGVPAGGSFVAPNKLSIVSAVLVWGAAITGAATNNFIISFFNRGAAGAGTVQWATAITYANGTNAAKATPVTLTLSSTASDLLVASGDVISVELTVNGSGLICPGGAVMLTVKNR